MKILFLALVSLSLTARADTKLVIGKQVFSVSPIPDEQPRCNDGPGGSENTAAIFLMNTAQGLGEQSGNAAAGIESVFKLIRRYPSRFKSPNWTGPLRDECEKNARRLKVLSLNVVKSNVTTTTWNN